MFGEYRIVGSGGTTGKRGVVVYDQPAWDVAVASLLHMLTGAGCLAGDARARDRRTYAPSYD